MTTKHFAIAIMATLFIATAAAQSGADLLQKGIYAQETLGDLDGAIQTYRQVVSTAGVPKAIAAQAQYQLVLCMLQKGDRAAASHELDLLTERFPDQQDFINKARKLIPGAATMLAPPWTDGEASQLNIRRDGQFTGEYLYYAATPWRLTVGENERNADRSQYDRLSRTVYLSWELKTKTSDRAIVAAVDRTDMTPMDPDRFDTDDVLGDASAAPFAGPAIDAEPLVFRMRLLPLAAGYKTTMTTLPFLIGHGVPRSVELAVTGVEAVQTVAGKFNCYKVSLASLGQTFWIGVDGARPLVKFQSGNVEAELVHIWGPTVMDDAVAFLKKAGWTVSGPVLKQFANDDAPAGASTPERAHSVDISLRRIYTPPAEIDGELRKACSGGRLESVQLQPAGDYPSIRCIMSGTFLAWVRTESLVLRFSISGSVAVTRWMFEPLLDTIKLPKD